MGKIGDMIGEAIFRATDTVVKRAVNDESFKRGKEGNPPVFARDPELQVVADKAYAAGQAASLIQSAKKISEK